MDPDSRVITEKLRDEFSASVAKLSELNRQITVDEAALEEAIFDLYELTAGQRDTVNLDYGE